MQVTSGNVSDLSKGLQLNYPRFESKKQLFAPLIARKARRARPYFCLSAWLMLFLSKGLPDHRFFFLDCPLINTRRLVVDFAQEQERRCLLFDTRELMRVIKRHANQIFDANRAISSLGTTSPLSIPNDLSR